jgi:adenylosuccinate lyase
VAAVRQRRDEGSSAEDLLARLGADVRFPFDEAELRALVEQGPLPVGRATEQVAAFAARVEKLAAAHPGSATYTGGAVL